jgi:plastocyanin
VTKHRPGVALAAVGAALALAAAVATLAPTSDAATPPRVTVSMTEFKFVLAPRTARKGTVVFTVVNRGTTGHDFKIRGKKTRTIAAGRRATLTVSFARAGRYPYLCTLPSHAPAGMRGTLVVR